MKTPIPGSSSEMPLEEHREAIERIRKLKVKLYGLLKDQEVEEWQLGPILLQLHEENQRLHPEAMRNPEAREKFWHQVQSVLGKGMQLMTLLNPSIQDIDGLKRHEERWQHEHDKKQWAQILSRSTGKGNSRGKGKGKGKATQRPLSSDSEEIVESEGNEKPGGIKKHRTHLQKHAKRRYGSTDA